MAPRRARLWFIAVPCVLLGAAPGASPAQTPTPRTNADRELRVAGSVQELTEPLVLALRLGPYILSDGFVGYRQGDRLFLPLGEIVWLLDFPITVRPETGRAEGWFLSEKRQFLLDLNVGEVVVAGRPARLNPDQVQLRLEDVYVDAELLGQWFPVDFEGDLSLLLVIIKSREPLPIEQRLEREALRARLASGNFVSPVYPRMDVPYLFLDWPFVDVNIQSDYRRSETGFTNGQFTVFTSGDLLKMTSSIYVMGDRRESQPDARVKVRMDRQDPDGRLLGPLRARMFAFGDIYSPQDAPVSRGNAGAGVELSNFPLNQSSEFDRFTLRGELPAGWEVELRRNDALLSFQAVPKDGFYEFKDVPLVFGLNVLRLVFYGPHGQTREEVKRIYVGQDLVRRGDFYYRVAASRQDRDLFQPPEIPSTTQPVGEERFSAQFEAGLSRSLSVTAGLARLPFFDRRRDYGSLGLRAALLGTYSSAELTREEDGGTALDLGLQTRLGGLSLLGEHTRYAEFESEWVVNASDPVRSQSTVRVDGSIPRWWLPGISYTVAAGAEERESHLTYSSLSNRLSMTVWGISMSNTFFGFRTRGGGVKRDTRIDGSSLISARLGPTNVRGEFGYNIDPEEKVRSVALSGDWRIGRDFGASFGVTRDLSFNPRTSYFAGLNGRFQFLLFGLDGRYEEGGLISGRMSISFSLGREPREQRWVMRSERMASTGAISARVFLDANQNGVFDPDELLIEGVQFSHGVGGRGAATDSSGIAFISGLSTYRPTPVNIDPGSLKDPFWVPESGGVEVVPRPGKSMLLDFAVTPTGEIDGMTYLRHGETVREVSNVSLQLIDERGAVVETVRSGFDGFYLFTLVRPGRYTVRVAPDQLGRLRLVPPPDRDVVIEADGTIASGIDFTLEREVSSVEQSATVPRGEDDTGIEEKTADEIVEQMDERIPDSTAPKEAEEPRNIEVPVPVEPKDFPPLSKVPYPNRIALAEDLRLYVGKYLIHVSSFQSLEKAGKDADHLHARGLPVVISRVDLGTVGLWYRVYVGPAETVEQAHALLEVLERDPGVTFMRLMTVRE